MEGGACLVHGNFFVIAKHESSLIASYKSPPSTDRNEANILKKEKYEIM